MGGKNLSLHTPCRALFRHWSPSRQNMTSVVPRNSRGSALSIPRRPTSTRPRATAGQQRSKTCTPQDSGSFHHPILYVTMVSRDGPNTDRHHRCCCLSQLWRHNQSYSTTVEGWLHIHSHASQLLSGERCLWWSGWDSSMGRRGLLRQPLMPMIASSSISSTPRMLRQCDNSSWIHGESGRGAVQDAVSDRRWWLGSMISE
jgi:hypothetical protein